MEPAAAIFTFLSIGVSLASALECFVGSGDDYVAVDCSLHECVEGVECMCMKAPDFQGRDVRQCWANPHGGQRPMCFVRAYFLGEVNVPICTCQDNLCNGAGSIDVDFVGAWTLTALTTATSALKSL